MPSFLAPLLSRPAQPAVLVVERTRAVLASQIEPAFDSSSRRTGLLGRDHLADGSALVLAPCAAVHTFFMRFPIDIAHVTRDGRVLRMRESLGPWRISGAWRAYATIELAAGSLRRADVRVGDRLTLQLR